MGALDVFDPELSLAARAFVVAVSPAVTQTAVVELEKVNDSSYRGLEEIVFLTASVKICREKSQREDRKQYDRDKLHNEPDPEHREEKPRYDI